jgi:hypothetical protein
MIEIRLNAFIVMAIQLTAENWSAVSCFPGPDPLALPLVVFGQSRNGLGQGQRGLLGR